MKCEIDHSFGITTLLKDEIETEIREEWSNGHHRYLAQITLKPILERKHREGKKEPPDLPERPVSKPTGYHDPGKAF
jgi:hypothetical protein